MTTTVDQLDSRHARYNIFLTLCSSLMQNPMSTDATRPPADDVLVDIADYVLDYRLDSDEAWSTARRDGLPVGPHGTGLGSAGHAFARRPASHRRRGLEMTLAPNQCDALMALFLDSKRLSHMPVDEFVSRLVV